MQITIRPDTNLYLGINLTVLEKDQTIESVYNHCRRHFKSAFDTKRGGEWELLPNVDPTFCTLIPLVQTKGIRWDLMVIMTNPTIIFVI